MIKCAFLVMLLGAVYAVANGSEYRSDKNQFTISYDSDWKTSASPDLTIEIALVPNSAACSSTAFLSIGALYDQRLSRMTTDDFLKIATGEAITGQVKKMPVVTNFKLLREGKVKLGEVNAYEVLMSYTTPAGARYRHTFMTFNKGYVYNASFHSTPENFKADFEISKKVFKTFKFTP